MIIQEGTGEAMFGFNDIKMCICQSREEETGVKKVNFSTVWKSFGRGNRGDLARLWKSGKNMEK